MIGAVILAAGQSRRMGQPKMLLPWGDHTVIAQVVGALEQGGASPIWAVLGGSRAAVQAALEGLPVKTVLNPRYEQDEMVYSLQVGLQALPAVVQAVLVALGDQPQIPPAVVQAVIAAYRASGAALVVPSYRLRRGHPWLVARSLWPDLLALRPPATLRDFLHAHTAAIHYLPLETDLILRDLDTPEDYQRERPPIEANDPEQE